jgi:hypothetical protein
MVVAELMLLTLLSATGLMAQAAEQVAIQEAQNPVETAYAF